MNQVTQHDKYISLNIFNYKKTIKNMYVLIFISNNYIFQLKTCMSLMFLIDYLQDGIPASVIENYIQSPNIFMQSYFQEMPRLNV